MLKVLKATEIEMLSNIQQLILLRNILIWRWCTSLDQGNENVLRQMFQVKKLLFSFY